MNNKLETYCRIELPYLRATISFADMSKLKGISIKSAGYTCLFNREENDGGINIAVFIEDIKEAVKQIENMPIIAHELVHVLQHISDHISSGISEEKEHLAYLMHYMMEKLLETNPPLK